MLTNSCGQPMEEIKYEETWPTTDRFGTSNEWLVTTRRHPWRVHSWDYKTSDYVYND